jgi:fluoroacetyl-CoA thioesterase
MSRTSPPISTLSPTIVAGLTATVQLTVAADDTAACVRTGDVPVLATPRLVALCEEACCRTLAGHLLEDRTSVASRIQFDHLVPVPVGATVRAEATLEKVEGRRLVFTLSVTLDEDDRGGLVAAGRLTRVVVHRSAFLAKAGCPQAG